MFAVLMFLAPGTTGCGGGGGNRNGAVGGRGIDTAEAIPVESESSSPAVTSTEKPPDPPPPPVDASSLYIQSITVNPSSIGHGAQAEVVVRVGNHGSGRSRRCGVSIRGFIRSPTGVSDVPLIENIVPEIDPGQTIDVRGVWRPATNLTNPAGRWEVYAVLKSWLDGQVISKQEARTVAFAG